MFYPAERMKHAIGTLYMHIIEFLVRAVEWYSQSGLKHAFTSIIQPFQLYFKDILEDIIDSIRLVDQIAIVSAQAEQLDMHILLQEMKNMMSRAYQTYTFSTYLLR